MLRIRDNEATIRQLKFPENTLEKLRTNDSQPEIVVNASLVEQIEIRFAKGEFVPDSCTLIVYVRYWKISEVEAF